MVNETKADIKTAAATVIPNSLNKLPTKPCKKITGKNTTASVIEVEITAKNISLLPSSAALLIGNPSSSFLNMFSVTTIPSSTTRPVASTIPRSVNTLMENPKMYMIKNVAMSEIGMSIIGRIAINQFLKKKKITSTTSVNEISRVSSTSLIALLTFFVWSINGVNSKSPFSFFLISSTRL